jgi:hypothetical protein
MLDRQIAFLHNGSTYGNKADQMMVNVHQKIQAVTNPRCHTYMLTLLR